MAILLGSSSSNCRCSSNRPNRPLLHAMSIGNDESLGRRVAGRRASRRARLRGKGTINDFVPKPGSAEISHDRLSIADRRHLLGIAKEQSENDGKMFRGWLAVIAKEIASEDRTPIDSPNSANPYHADIKLTDDCAASRECQKGQAQVLANKSRWVDPDVYDQSGA